MFQDLGAEVIGVSTDSLTSHEAFCEAQGYPFPLASDQELAAARLYDVVGDEGNRSRRAVFVIDKGGTILHKIPYYSPASLEQFQEIFKALGMEL